MAELENQLRLLALVVIVLEDHLRRFAQARLARCEERPECQRPAPSHRRRAKALRELVTNAPEVLCSPRTLR